MGLLALSIIVILLALVGFLTVKVLRLARKNKELKSVLDAKDQFFVTVSHELKNPLNAQTLILKNLRDSIDTLPEESVKQYVTELYRSSSSITQLLNNIFIIRQVKTEGNLHNLVRSNLLDFVNDTLDTVLDQAKLKEVEIRNEVDPGCFVMIDRNMIATVLRNLVSNAIKFSYKGGTVTVTSKDAGNGSVELSVTDQGVGITPENISKVYSSKAPFTTKGTAGETGCGLGLLTSKRIVEAFGGTVTLVSKVGEGSTFSFTVKKDS